MKLWIGSCSGTMAEQLQEYFAKEKLIKKHLDNYYLVEITEESISSLSDSLSAIMLESFLPDLLLSVLREVDPPLSSNQLKKLSADFLKNLRREGLLKRYQEIISRRIRQHLKETPILSLEGMLFFRCTDVHGSLRKRIFRRIQVHHLSQMLTTLREYIQTATPKVDYLKIHEQNGKFLLYDRQGRRIIPTFSQQFTPEEELLNSLLFFSPQFLNISLLKDPSMHTVISEIFFGHITED